MTLDSLLADIAKQTGTDPAKVTAVYDDDKKCINICIEDVDPDDWDDEESFEDDEDD